MSTRMQFLCLVLAGLFLAAATSHLRRPVAQKNTATAQHYAYCSECGLEMTVPSELEQKKTFCPHCGVDHPMQISTHSQTNGEGPVSRTNWPFVATVFAVPTALAIGVYSLSRARRRGGSVAEEDVYEFTCPGCGHTMASKSYRKGSTAVCPACAELFVVGSSDAEGIASDRPDEQRELEDGLRNKLRKKKTSRSRKPRPGPPGGNLQ
jgi:predicted RNA-binding Zn-ribbon protein involved in translation (DUF1610 family)